MANTPQAKKRIRRNANRAEINGARVSRIRTFIKAVESALASGKKDDAADALQEGPARDGARRRARRASTRTPRRARFSRLSKRVAALG